MSDTRQREYQKSLDRLTEILTDIVVEADERSLTRCPYKNARDECTARFGCRNQRRRVVDGEKRLLCVGDDKLDYRAAWESDPQAVRQAGDALAANRGGGRPRRASGRPQRGAGRASAGAARRSRQGRAPTDQE